ncbi:MAG: sulfatase [Fimbriimonadaceae bacterium]|nr:sulfatase [Fimbriimonadaceae bacterium]
MSARPNILFIITHDTGRHVGGYGLGVQTPQIDRLAAAGVRFQQCFCSAPQCSPSRCSAITGLAPHNHGEIGLTHRGFRLRPGVATTPQLLAAAGYQTRLFGVQHESPDPVGETGYQHWTKGHQIEAVAADVADWLGSGPQQPFFASVGSFETHRVFPSSGDTPLDEVYVPPYLPDTPETRRDFADFNGELAKVDRAVGTILDALEAAGLDENTLVVYTTDHGVAFPGAKGTLFDPGIGIACVMRGPGGFRGGQEIAALVSNIDYLPTFCDLAGVPVPAEVQGRSLRPLVTGEATALRDEVFVEMTYHAAYDPLRGVRTRTHKYIRSYEYRPYWFGPNVDDGRSKQYLANGWQFATPRPRELLFDLTVDPWEQANLARDPAHAAALTELRAKLDRYLDETGDMIVKGSYDQPPGTVVTPATNWQPPEAPE